MFYNKEIKIYLSFIKRSLPTIQNEFSIEKFAFLPFPVPEWQTAEIILVKKSRMHVNEQSQPHNSDFRPTNKLKDPKISDPLDPRLVFSTNVLSSL